MSFEDAVKLLLLSFDSTIKANLSVGLPLDLHVYETGDSPASPPQLSPHIPYLVSGIPSNTLIHK
jgi:putative proteasome-type protease